MTIARAVLARPQLLIPDEATSFGSHTELLARRGAYHRMTRTGSSPGHATDWRPYRYCS
jgi:ABC-type multidrug transport system fused ATPase/permease subunit